MLEPALQLSVLLQLRELPVLPEQQEPRRSVESGCIQLLSRALLHTVSH